MVTRLRERTGWRRAALVLAVLALALKMIVPPGFMPGTSLADPIVLCPDQGPMPGMAMPAMAMPAMAMPEGHGGSHTPSKSPHDATDHPCAFAGLGMASLATPFDGPGIAPGDVAPDVPVASGQALAPGRGLAAPPPPSRAPPAFRT